MTNKRYSQAELSKILRRYELLDAGGKLSSLLSRVSRCTKCAAQYPGREDLPVNALVRPIPLTGISTDDRIAKYCIRIKRDDTLLRRLLKRHGGWRRIANQLFSAKFSIGLLPWSDRCMLFRRHRETALMVVGIDYKHFPVFCSQPADQDFPLDSYSNKTKIWGPTWRKFWANLIGDPSDDDVNEYIYSKGIFMTNSMLCFGGSSDPRSHYYGYLECCRPFIAQMIHIVRPKTLVSFGILGMRNVASILLAENSSRAVLRDLSKPVRFKDVSKILKKHRCKNGIKASYGARQVVFWPLRQPARTSPKESSANYDVLRQLIDRTS